LIATATTPGGEVQAVQLNRAGCINVCEHGPVMVVYPEAVWYK
jgi:(2Fe-2S) ferredoxin